jgi:transcriptional regulator with XRE-family HTH domain
MKIPNEQIGQNVSILRKGKSQKGVAAAMKERGHAWSQATVSSVETGERPLRLSEAVDLATVLGVPIEDMFDDTTANYINTIFRRLDNAQRSLGAAIDEYLVEVSSVTSMLAIPDLDPDDEAELQKILCESPARIFASGHESGLKESLIVTLPTKYDGDVDGEIGLRNHDRRVSLMAATWDQDAAIIMDNPVTNV